MLKINHKYNKNDSILELNNYHLKLYVRFSLSPKNGLSFCNWSVTSSESAICCGKVNLKPKNKYEIWDPEEMGVRRCFSVSVTSSLHFSISDWYTDKQNGVSIQIKAVYARVAKPKPIADPTSKFHKLLSCCSCTLRVTAVFCIWCEKHGPQGWVYLPPHNSFKPPFQGTPLVYVNYIGAG